MKEKVIVLIFLVLIISLVSFRIGYWNGKESVSTQHAFNKGRESGIQENIDNRCEQKRCIHDLVIEKHGVFLGEKVLKKSAAIISLSVRNDKGEYDVLSMTIVGGEYQSNIGEYVFEKDTHCKIEVEILNKTKENK